MACGGDAQRYAPVHFTGKRSSRALDLEEDGTSAGSVALRGPPFLRCGQVIRYVVGPQDLRELVITVIGVDI